MLPTMSAAEQKTMRKIPKLDIGDDLDKLKGANAGKAIVILFWAEWDDNSETLKSMMEEMPKVYQNL